MTYKKAMLTACKIYEYRLPLMIGGILMTVVAFKKVKVGQLFYVDKVGYLKLSDDPKKLNSMQLRHEKLYQFKNTDEVEVND